MTEQPSGTVTFVFTDIEGSTRLLEELGAEAYREALDRHRIVVREAFGRFGGYEVDYEGDAFFYAFASASSAVAAVVEAQAGLAGGPICVRIGVHTGEPALDPPKYVGLDVHKAARIMAAGHGGQVLVSAATEELLDGALELSDLGEHRLKDIAEPERLYQLGAAEFPPLKTLYQVRLPVPASSFLGREQELDELVALLRGEGQLVALTGPGGTGKTRLALQAAARASAEFPAGVWWVPLAPLRDAGLLGAAIAEALGVAEEPGGTLEDAVVKRLAGTRSLVLLDNAEHLLPDAAAEIARLLATTGTVRWLVTSRERLRLTGEQVYPVAPLDDVTGEQLFVERSRAAGAQVEPDETVRALCARLDNLPLALELAAARTPLFSPRQLVDRLGQRLDLLKGGRDADPRQQTLRATIAWSHELLDPAEQALFARLSVFAGGCGYEAAERVAGAEPDSMQSLLDKSLVRRRDTETGPRYWMLETIREYAAEQLAEPAACLDEHAGWMLDLARPAFETGADLGPPGWLDAIRADEANLQVALAHLERTAPERFMELCAAGWTFWYFAGRVSEGRVLVERAQRVATPETPLPIRARLFCALSNLAFRQGDGTVALAAAEEEVRLRETEDDRRWLPLAYLDLGNALHSVGRIDDSITAYEQAGAHAREVGDLQILVGSLANTTQARSARGEWELARDVGLQAVEAAREADDEYSATVATFNLAFAWLGLGELDRAEALFVTTLDFGVRHGFAEGMVYPFEALAMIDARRGECARAALLLGAAAELRATLGLRTEEPHASFVEDAREHVTAALGAEERERLEREGAAMPSDDVVERAIRGRLPPA